MKIAWAEVVVYNHEIVSSLWLQDSGDLRFSRKLSTVVQPQLWTFECFEKFLLKLIFFLDICQQTVTSHRRSVVRLFFCRSIDIGLSTTLKSFTLSNCSCLWHFIILKHSWRGHYPSSITDSEVLHHENCLSRIRCFQSWYFMM